MSQESPSRLGLTLSKSKGNKGKIVSFLQQKVALWETSKGEDQKMFLSENLRIY